MADDGVALGVREKVAFISTTCSCTAHLIHNPAFGNSLWYQHLALTV